MKVSVSDAAEAAFIEGLKALEKQQLNRALEKFTRAYVLNPKEPRYQGYRAWAQYYVVDEGDESVRLEITEQCHQELEEAVANCPDYDPLHVLLGTVYLTENRPQQAVTVFEKALAINADNSGAAIGLKTANKKLRGSTIQSADLGYLKVVEPLKPDSPEMATPSNDELHAPVETDHKPTLPVSMNLDSEPPVVSKNRIETSTGTPSTIGRSEISKSGNVFSTVRLRSEIDGLKRARQRDLTTFQQRESKQAEELNTLRDHYEKNISNLEETIEKLSAEKSAITQDFELSKEYFEKEKKKIALLLAEHESVSSALKLSHDEIRSQVDKAKEESLDVDTRLAQQRERLKAERGQLQVELDSSQEKLNELEFALDAERQMLEVSDQSNEELIREFEQARSRYEKEIEVLRHEKSSLLQVKTDEQTKYTKRIAELEETLAQTNKQKGELESKSDIEQLQQIIAKSEADLEEAILSLEESNAARGHIQEELNERTIQLDALREELTRLEEQTSTQAQENARLSENNDTAESLAEAHQRNNDLVQIVEKLESQIEDAHDEKSRLSNELEASAAEVDFLRSQRKENEEALIEVASLKKLLKQRENDLLVFQQDNETLTGHINTQQEKLVEAQESLDLSAKEIADLRECLSSSGSLEDLHALEEQVQESQLRLEEEESKSHILKSRITERNEKLENQEIQLSTQRIEMASLQRANSELSQLQSTKDKVIKNLQDELNLLEQTFRDLPSSDEYEKLRLQLQEQTNELANYDEIRSALQSEISNISTEQTERIQRLVAENQELVGQLHDMAALQSSEHEHTVQTEDSLRLAKQSIRELEKKNLRLQSELDELAEKNRVLPSADDFSRITELLNDRDSIVAKQDNDIQTLEEKIAHQKTSFEAKIEEFVEQIHELKSSQEQARIDFDEERRSEIAKELSLREENERLESELNKLRNLHDSELTQQKTRQEDEIEKINLAHGEEMQLLQVQNESHLKRIQVELGRYQDAMQAKASLEKRFEDTSLEHASQLDRLEAEYAKAISELENQWTDKLSLAEDETQRLRDEIALVLSENAEIQENLENERGKSAQSISAKQQQDEKYAQTARELASVLDTVQTQIEQQKQAMDALQEQHKEELEAAEQEKAALTQEVENRDQLLVQSEEDARELRAKFRRAQEQIAKLLEQQIELRQSSISMIESSDLTNEALDAEVGSMDIVEELTEDDMIQESSIEAGPENEDAELSSPESNESEMVEDDNQA